jgi:hypothetical protein
MAGRRWQEVLAVSGLTAAALESFLGAVMIEGRGRAVAYITGRMSTLSSAGLIRAAETGRLV